MSKIKSNKLSFAMDEGDEEEDVFVGKKNGGSSDSSNQKFKKIRQAPSLAPIETPVATTTIGNSYSSENLKQLRESQKFAESKKFDDSVPMEGVELSGEAAEEMEHKLNSTKPKVRFSLEAEQEPSDATHASISDTPDFIAFKTGQLTSNHILKGKHNTKMPMSFTKKKETFDMSQDNDEEWEAEMARRGGLQNNTKAPPTVMSKAFTIGEDASKEEITVNTNKVKYSFGSGGASGTPDASKYVTVEDASKMIQLAVGKLTLQQEATERQILMLETEISEAEKEYAVHKDTLEAELKKQNVIQDTQEFFRNLIGMLREKQSQIENLKISAYDMIRAQHELIKRQRIEQQEDILFRVKEAGELMAIGDYTPSAIFNNSDPAALVLSLSSLKPREAAARLSRLKALDDLTNEDITVSPDDKQYFVANRIDRIHPFALEERLYALELAAGSSSVGPQWQEKCSSFLDSVESVMSDVEPSVYDMNEAVKQLTTFRDTFPERYKSAYISPSLPEVLEPLLWYDVVSCTATLLPSAGGARGSDTGSSSSGGTFVVSERSWHEPLREFSAMSVGDEEAAKHRNTLAALVDEGDTNLLPKLVAAVLLPWLTDVIRVGLDPVNTEACNACSDLISQLLDYDISDVQLAPLLEVLIGVFSTEISCVCLPVVKNPAIRTSAESDSNAVAAGLGRAFVLQQLYRLWTVLQNLLLFRDYLTPLVLMRIGWSTLTGKCLAPMVKLLSATDFQNVELIRNMCLVCCTMIEGESAMDLSHTLQCGVKIPLFRELKTTLNRMEHERLDTERSRVSLLAVLNKL